MSDQIVRITLHYERDDLSAFGRCEECGEVRHAYTGFDKWGVPLEYGMICEHLAESLVAYPDRPATVTKRNGRR